MDATLTYRELDAHSKAFAAWLQQAGLRKGDRIAIMLPNTLQYPIAMFGALRAGIVVVNTNPLYTAPELEHQLVDSGAAAILVLENFAHVVQSVLPRTQMKHVLVTSVGDCCPFRSRIIVNFVVRRVRKQVPPWHIAGAIDFKSLSHPAAVQSRSRSMSAPRISPSCSTPAAPPASPRVPCSPTATSARTSCRPSRPVAGRRTPGTLITAIPLYHIFALSGNCMVFARLGWTNVLIINPRDLTP